MTTRVRTIQRGKVVPNQRFSAVRPIRDATFRTLLDVLSPTVNAQRRTQILGDPTYCHQFAYVWGRAVGFVTRPRITDHDGNVIVVGNFTDTIGEPCPISLPLGVFQGFFTTLVRKGDAEALRLTIHPMAPDTIPGPPLDPAQGGPADALRSNQAAPVPVEASMERLGFTIPENSTDADIPVIVALPMALPLSPGLSYPHLMAIDDAQSFREPFLLFEVYRQGYLYALQHNGGQSVTEGGPLFHQPAFDTIPDDQNDPFIALSIVEGIEVPPTQLSPTSTLYAVARTSFLEWSESMWQELGSNQEPELINPPAAAGFTPADFREAVKPLVDKEKVFRLGKRIGSKYKILMSALPLAGAAQQDNMVLPELKGPFKEFLNQGTSSIAADDVKEQLRACLTLAQNSALAVNQGVTLEADNLTLAFSDKMRTFAWLVEKLICTSLTAARNQLGLIHMLTPSRDALALVSEFDKDAMVLVMSNSSSGTAQLDASKSSKLYSGGRLNDFHDVYTAVLNLRAVLSLVVEDLDRPLVLVKMLEYANLLITREGRLFFAAHRDVSLLAVHPWQDLQTIFSSFASVATNTTLYTAVEAGGEVAKKNFDGAIAVSTTVTNDLRSMLYGNGLGKFQGSPLCGPWFCDNVPPPVVPRGRGAMPPLASRDQATGPRDQSAKKQKTADLGPDEIERRRGLGVLQLTGSQRLPTCPVLRKKKGAKAPERLCMGFMTKGHYCAKTNAECRFPHVTSVGTLPEHDQKKLIQFVASHPGLSWVDGKAPPGTI